MNPFDPAGGFNVKLGKQAKVRIKMGADDYEDLRAQDWKLNPSFSMQDLTPLGFDGKYEVPDQTSTEGSLTMFFRTDSKAHQRIIGLFADIETRTAEGGTGLAVSSANSSLMVRARFFLDATHFYEAEISIKGVSKGISVGNKMSFDVTFSVRGVPKFVVLLSSVSLAPATVSVARGATAQITPTVTNPPSNYTLNWVSAAPTIATVDQNGLVTGVLVGTSTITCEVLDWGIVVARATRTVTVTT